MLRLTGAAHTHKGKRYVKGEVFEGTESLLKALRDRVERVEVPKPKSSK